MNLDLSEQIERKFVESYNIDDWEIETEDGWKPITSIHKTIKYDVWELKTEFHELRCADDHIVIVEGFQQKFVKDLDINDKVITVNGLEKVVSVCKLDIPQENMYDVTVDSENHTFFTNGILSHNTTVTTIFLLWYALFNRDKNIVVIANKEDTAKEILKKIKMAYQELPLWLQSGITEGGWNAKSIELGNGSRILAASTSADSISGMAVSLLFVDEFAKISAHLAQDFIASTYPVISSGKTSKIIIVSTPFNGMNHFYEFWTKAIRGKNNFYPIKVRWWDHPDRDQQWKKEMIADIGKLRFMQEFECKFLGSTETLIDSDVLEKLEFIEPVTTKYTGLLSVYEEPIKECQYILGVDTAKGTGRDYSVIQVLKINNDQSLEQVAVYRNNFIRSRDYAQVCISVSRYYNDAMMMIENNDVGSIVCDVIWYDYECDRIVNLDPKGLGIRSTKTTKPLANDLLKEYVEKGFVKIVDQNTIVELGKYEEVSQGVFACDNGNDDCVTSLLWALYFVKTEFYDGPIVSVTGEIEDRYRIKEEECDMPVMILD